MARKTWLTIAAAAVAAAVVACAPPAPERRIIDDLAAALGGRERVQAVRTLSLEGEGTQYNLGQDLRPGASGQTFSVTSFRRLIDIPAGRARTELTRTPNFPYFQGQAPQRQVQGIDGEVGFNIAASGAATRVANQAASDRRAELYHHPLTIARAALDPAAKLANPRTEGNERLVEVTTASGQTLTLALDGSTGLPARVQSRTYHANLGDVTITTSFGGYQDVSGLKLPASLTTKIDDFTTAEIRVTKQSVDGEVGDLAAPAAAASAAPIAAPPPPNVAAEEVAKGIWLLAGQSHHSVLVELSDHSMLIEAPQSAARTLAVIAKARELVPGKPLTKLVTTHHHFDHTAGLRAAISEGLAVVTHAGNRAFVEEMAKRPHTIVSDALAKNPKPLTIETVDEELVLQDAATTVALYHVAGNPHSDTMLMGYFPRERILVEADVYSPGSQVHPYAANLLDNVRRRSLRVDRVVPLHGAIVPFAELVKTQTPKTN